MALSKWLESELDRIKLVQEEAMQVQQVEIEVQIDSSFVSSMDLLILKVIINRYDYIFENLYQANDFQVHQAINKILDLILHSFHIPLSKFLIYLTFIDQLDYFILGEIHFHIIIIKVANSKI